MQNIKDAANAVGEKAKGKKLYKLIIILIYSFIEVTSGASYESNKQAAKNDNLSAGSRVGHGIDAVKDKGNFIFLIK